MANRVCLDCPAIGNWTRGRCAKHERARDKKRGTTTQRGYDSVVHDTPIGRMPYSACRKEYQRRMNQGIGIECWRCGEEVDPEHWTLGHHDEDRSRIMGPECPPCNYVAAGKMSARFGRI